MVTTVAADAHDLRLQPRGVLRGVAAATRVLAAPGLTCCLSMVYQLGTDSQQCAVDAACFRSTRHHRHHDAARLLRDDTRRPYDPSTNARRGGGHHHGWSQHVGARHPELQGCSIRACTHASRLTPRCLLARAHVLSLWLSTAKAPRAADSIAARSHDVSVKQCRSIWPAVACVRWGATKHRVVREVIRGSRF